MPNQKNDKMFTTGFSKRNDALPFKTAEQVRIETLEKQVQELRLERETLLKEIEALKQKRQPPPTEADK